MTKFDLLCSGFDFLECPTVAPAGNLYFVDRAALFELDTEGVVHRLLERSIGGVVLHQNGGLVLSGDDIALFNRGVLFTIVSPDGCGEFNDICADAHGCILAGTVLRKSTDAGAPRPSGHLWRVDKSGAATDIYSDVGFSNGLAFAPNDTRLYHADTYRREIIVYNSTNIRAPRFEGRFSTAAAGGVPDGLAVDEAGCVWVAMFDGGCVARFLPSGVLDMVVDVPARRVTSVCFAGSDRRDLIVVTCDNSLQPELGGCIFSTRAPVAGLRLHEATVNAE